MAREAGIDLVALHRRLGRPVLAADVRVGDAALRTQVEPQLRRWRSGRRGVSHTWRTMAERTLASWQTVPHFSLQRELDARRLLDWQRLARERSGARITVTDVLVRVVAHALAEHPALGRSLVGRRARREPPGSASGSPSRSTTGSSCQ